MDASAVPLGPGDLPQLFTVLQGALSSDPATQKSAEYVLQSLETRTGYCSCLAEVLATPSAPHASRWLSVTQLKNSITKYWRPRSSKCISDQEKLHLRSKLLSLITEEDNQIAAQIAVIFAKLAHYDYPNHWPSLLSDIAAQLTANHVTTQRRVYLILHHIIKELAAKRLAADQQVFAQVCKQLFGDAWRQWLSDNHLLATQLAESIQRGEQQLSSATQLTLERWTLLLKIVWRLVLYGYPSDAKTVQQVAAVAEVAPALLQQCQQMLALRQQIHQHSHQGMPQGTSGPAVSAALSSCAKRMVKVLGKMQEVHPWSFHHCGVLIPCLELTLRHIISSAQHDTAQRGDDMDSEILLLHCLLFVSGVLNCPAYRGKTSSILLTTAGAKLQADTIKAAATEVQQKLSEFWTADRVRSVVIILVETYFTLTAVDTEEWHSDGEQFHHDMDTLCSSGNERVRPAAENLYLILLKNHQSVVASAVVDMLKQANEACPVGFTPSVAEPLPGSFPAAVLYKDAVYTAAAVGSNYLINNLDFKSWLQNALLQECSADADWLKPVRRRALLLIGQWVKEVPREQCVAAYGVLGTALGAPDAAIQLAAVRALHNLVDDFDFREEDFQPFLGTTFQMLAALLRNTSLLDTHTQVFNLLNVFIERMGVEVRQYAGALMQLLPVLWDANSQQPLIRVQVLVALSNLINVLGPECTAAYPIIVPLVQYSTDIKQADQLLLLEDGLQLFLVSLRNAPTPHTPLLDLVSNLTHVTNASTEHLVSCSSILVSVVLLGGRQFLLSHGPHVVSILQALIGNVNDRGMKLLLPVMDVILQSFSEEGATLLEAPLQSLLRCIMAGQEAGTVIAASLNIFSRLLLHSPGQWMSFFVRAAASSSWQLPAATQHHPATPGQLLMAAFVDLWMEKFDMIGAAPSRKLNALALSVLPSLPCAMMLGRLDVIVSNLVSVIYEEQDEGSVALMSRYDYRSFCSVDQCGGEGEDSAAVQQSCDAEGEVYRRRALADQDPVNTLKLGDWLKQQFHAAAALHGPAFQEAMSHMDPSIAQQMQQALGR